MDRRNRDLSKLSQSLGKMLETQLKTVRTILNEDAMSRDDDNDDDDNNDGYN